MPSNFSSAKRSFKRRKIEDIFIAAFCWVKWKNENWPTLYQQFKPFIYPTTKKTTTTKIKLSCKAFSFCGVDENFLVLAIKSLKSIQKTINVVFLLLKDLKKARRRTVSLLKKGIYATTRLLLRLCTRFARQTIYSIFILFAFYFRLQEIEDNRDIKHEKSEINFH